MDTDNGPFLELVGSIYRFNIGKNYVEPDCVYLISDLRNNLRISAF